MHPALWLSLSAPIALVALLAAAAGQETAGPTDLKLVPGYLDPKTHTFTPAPLTALLTGDPAATVVLKGKIAINVAVTIKSAIPKSASFTSTATISASDATYTNGVGKQFALTRVGTTGAKGALTLTYNWRLASKSEMVQVEVYVVVNSSSGPRPFVHNKQFIALPANNGTATVTFPVTL